MECHNNTRFNSSYNIDFDKSKKSKEQIAFEKLSSGSGTSHRNSDFNIHSILNNKYNCNIIYYMFDVGYSYNRELDRLLGVDSRHYLNILIREGIITHYQLTQEDFKFEKIAKGLTDYHAKRIKYYTLTQKGKDILYEPMYFHLIDSNVTQQIITYRSYLIKVYDSKIEDIKKKEEFFVRQQETRYRILKIKKFKTAEDYIFIQMYEKNNN